MKPEPKKDKPAQLPPGRAVTIPLKGGGFLMLSCTAKKAAEIEDHIWGTRPGEEKKESQS